MNKSKSEISCLKWKFSILKSGLILKFPIPEDLTVHDFLDTVNSKNKKRYGPISLT